MLRSSGYSIGAAIFCMVASNLIGRLGNIKYCTFSTAGTAHLEAGVCWPELGMSSCFCRPHTCDLQPNLRQRHLRLRLGSTRGATTADPT
ncbi:Transcriptional activator protein Pur-alpha [Frankliniella fusca]|uniref:Transcriptional activator protein Pur-alpha n=1 Tax=Frankliniella fusca TaxID=407009 RepID=A0AAE1HRV2_9NEOP|nr:Transcriptional activator protein Pur-alpha [Frankliniella fusca]KAK3928040.1 Transcriptional activator protein Pur-alpha [Frankliniella fusca]